MDNEWITSRTGINERRILKGEGKGSSALGAKAVKGLFIGFVLSTIALVTPIETTNVNFELFLGVGFLLSLMFFIYFHKGLNKITASILFIGYITFLYLQFYG